MESGYQKQKLKLAFKEILKSPALYICSAIMLTQPWWLGAWTYLFLKSFLYAPSGAIAWLALSVIAAFILGETGYFFYSVSMMRKRAQLGIMARPKHWPFAISLVAMQFMIGPGLALSFWFRYAGRGDACEERQGDGRKASRPVAIGNQKDRTRRPLSLVGPIE